jgi:glycosyltransferase involved in cell wall biosynthesis
MVQLLCPDRNIRFPGHTPDHEWLTGTDVLVSACDIEGFGRCVIEAGSAGIPQIVPDRGGSSELVVPGLTGLIYAGGVPGLTDAMAEAAAWSRTRLEAFGQRAHVHARSYSHTRCFMAYAQLALEVCQSARHRQLTGAGK